jgi:RNA polymerase sigma factor (sigma-70 family)
MAAQLDTILKQVRALGATQARADVSDGDLLRRFIDRRDEAAFSLLAKRHGPMVLSVGRRLLGREHDAEEVFQATFLLLARKAGSIRKGGSVGSWLYGVAYRLAARTREQRAQRRAHERQAAARRTAELRAAGAWQELQAVLDDALAGLPEKYRAPLVLCYLEGKTQEEVARQLGCPLGTVRSWLARGRTMLRRQLARRGVPLSAGAVATALVAGAASAATVKLPPNLLHPTLRAALQFAAGQEVNGLVSGQVTHIAKGGLTTTVTAKLRAGSVLLIALTALLAGVGLAARQGLGAKPADGPAPLGKGAGRPKASEERLPPRVDAFGDPLPDGAFRRLGTVRFRPGGGPVNSLLPGPDGKTLLSNCYYGVGGVCLWELATGKLLRQFPGNYEYKRVALSPDGSTLALAAGEAIRLLDVRSGKELRRLRGHREGAYGFAFSPDGKTLASGGFDNTIRFWDPASGKEEAPLATEHARVTLLAFSPDGKTLASGDYLNSAIDLWDVRSRKRLRRLERASAVGSFVFSPDGATLAAGGRDGTIPLWAVRTGKLVRELRREQRLVLAVAFSPDGKTLASGDLDPKGEAHAVCLWDVAGGKALREIKGDFGPVGSVAFSADGKTVICADLTIRLWDAATGQERGPAAGRHWAGNVTLSPDGRTLGYTAKDIVLWDLVAGEELGTLPGLRYGLLSLAFSPDGKTLAAGSYENAIYLWDVGGRKLLRRLEGDKKNAGLAFGHFSSVAFSPDGATLASGGHDGAVRLWAVATGRERRRLDLKDHENEFCTVEAVAFSPDGKTLAASGRTAEGSKVRLWDAATGKRLGLTAEMNAPSRERPASASRSWEEVVAPRIVFSPDGRMLAMNRWQKAIPVWEAASGKERCRLAGHQESTVCVGFSADSRTLASAGWDGTVRLWDLETGKELGQRKGHRGKANSLAFSPDGKALVSAGDDSTVLFWDVAAVTGRQRPRADRLAPREWEALWADLAGADAVKARQAMSRLMAAPGPAVLALKERLRPVPACDPRHLARVLKDLDSGQFAVRQTATRDLEKLGDAVRLELENALTRPDSLLESRQRLRRFLDALAVPSGDRLRQLRAVEVLERLGTPEARGVLEALATGARGARLTEEARAALERLSKRAVRGRLGTQHEGFNR